MSRDEQITRAILRAFTAPQLWQLNAWIKEEIRRRGGARPPQKAPFRIPAAKS